MAPVRRQLIAGTALMVLVPLGGIAGLVLFIVAMVYLGRGRVRRAYRFDGLPPKGPYDTTRRRAAGPYPPPYSGPPPGAYAAPYGYAVPPALPHSPSDQGPRTRRSSRRGHLR